FLGKILLILDNLYTLFIESSLHLLACPLGRYLSFKGRAIIFLPLLGAYLPPSYALVALSFYTKSWHSTFLATFLSLIASPISFSAGNFSLTWHIEATVQKKFKLGLPRIILYVEGALTPKNFTILVTL
ncbi:hypothetical protein Pfo_013896, partial [Paulownia fortunei]